MPRPQINRKTIEIDATGQVLGRLATHIARILIGKHKATYFPNVDGGDFVRVSHPGQIKLTGAKLEQKEYYHYSGYPGGMKTRKASELMVSRPEQLLRSAVDRMLPKNTLRARRIKRLLFSK